MKTARFHFLWVSLILAALAMLCPQTVSAAGATSTEINNAIVQEGSIPLTWENDATYPWTISNGKLQNGNAGIANSSAEISFRYSSLYPTTIALNIQTEDNSSVNTHCVDIYVDGNFKERAGNYSTSVKELSFRLTSGNHIIKIVDTIGNNTNQNRTANLWNVCVTESVAATETVINSTIVSDGSCALKWTNDSSYPWIVLDDSAIKSGNYGFRNSRSTLSFAYSSENTTAISFDVKKNDNSSSTSHAIQIYLDGNFKTELGNYDTNTNSILYRVPKGNHYIQIVDTINNNEDFQYYTILKNVKVLDYGKFEDAVLTSKSKPITLNDEGLETWYIEDGCLKSNGYVSSNSNSILTTNITVDKPSKFSFRTKVGYENDSHTSRFYINDEIYYASKNTDWNYVSVVLQPGNYTLKWEDVNKYSGNSYYTLIRDIELSDNCVDVSITPGMLGVEVLYKVNVLTDVEILKVKGTLNESDWSTITMMTNLKSLDLSEAIINMIADNQFNSLKYLNTIVLPEGVKTIGNKAFVGTNIYYLTIPSSVETIGREAFANTRLGKIDFAANSKLSSIGHRAFDQCKELKEFIMPNSVTTLETESYNNSYTFSNCTSLNKIVFSDALVSLPEGTCYNNSAVVEIHLPKNLVTIGDNFMYAANRLKELTLPESLRSIGRWAFAGLHTVEHLVLPEKLSTVGSGAFHNSGRLKIVEIPSGIGTLDDTFRGCDKIEKIICRAATPPAVSSDAFSSVTKANVTLEVPSFAVATYKLDPYWYQFGNIIEGEPTDYWKIIGDLKLLNNRRMEGKPDIDLYYNGKLTVGGDAAMPIGKFDIYTSDGNASSLVTDCPNITADEINTIYHVDANKWYFITPMVDVDLRQVNVTGTPNYVFRYYDGATRADIGAGTSWKNVSDMTLKSGVGYIFQCNAASDVIFPVPVNMHSRVLTTEAVTLPLVAHPSDNAANKGWNYVGNPFPSYYDIYYMDFTAPITVWTGSTYRAYSITDDNFVLRPMQGFFVQKPDAIDVITLQPAGRQIQSSVNRYQKSPSSRANLKSEDARAIFNIEIGIDTLSDVTRIVLNNNASARYEIERDASKFMSMDETVPQIYSIDSDNNHLAINERPEFNGEIPLGIFIPNQNETYSIRCTRQDGEAYLYDAELNVTHNLANGEYYFSAPNGTVENRFSIRLKSGAITGIDDIPGEYANKFIQSMPDGIEVSNLANSNITVYGLDGKVLHVRTSLNGTSFIPLAKGLYVVNVDGSSYKVLVK